MIDDLLFWIQMNWFWIAFFGIFAWVISGFFRKRKLSEKIVKHTQDTEKEAKDMGVNIEQKVSGRMASMGYGSAVEGDTHYAGTTGGINWKLLSSVQLTDRGTSNSINSRNLDVRKRSTRWNTTEAAWPQGRFLMLMATPGYDSAKHAIKRGGFFNKLTQMAGDFMLDVYVSGYFGSQYKSLVGIGEDGVKLDRPALNKFFILTNHEVLANKFLDDGTVNTIASWRNAQMGFRSESAVDNFGILFCADGMILGCQADMADPKEANKLAEFGSALALKMQQVLKS
jgi:hypothetical protein